MIGEVVDTELNSYGLGECGLCLVFYYEGEVVVPGDILGIRYICTSDTDAGVDYDITFGEGLCGCRKREAQGGDAEKEFLHYFIFIDEGQGRRDCCMLQN